MKKVKLSLAALALIFAIAGTVTAKANATVEETPLCADFDPKLQICTDGSNEPCCEDGATIYFYPPKY
jgi:hypothetical protein